MSREGDEQRNRRVAPSARRAGDGDDFLDLVEAVERGAVADDGGLEISSAPEPYTVELGSWDQMVRDLLELLAGDAGSVEKGLVKLGVPALKLIDAWKVSPTHGATESAKWSARSRSRRSGPPVLPHPRDLSRRGDSYTDLVEAAFRGALPGDGALDVARLRERYTVDPGPWLGMVGDLLAQVVGDAGSVERASIFLGVPLRSLTSWVRWLVARGSLVAARTTWPITPADQVPDPDAYADLAEAVVRGAVTGDGALEPPRLRGSYTVELDEWDHMTSDLLGQIVADAGSLRRAARVLGVPRSTLTARFSRRKR